MVALGELGTANPAIPGSGGRRAGAHGKRFTGGARRARAEAFRIARVTHRGPHDPAGIPNIQASRSIILTVSRLL